MKLNSPADVRHFHARLGFGGACGVVMQQSLQQDSAALLQNMLARKANLSRQPDITSHAEAVKLVDLPKEQKQPFIKQRNRDNNTLHFWWLEQIHHSTSPLLERMTLFWHNHFTSSAIQVLWPQLMYRQHQLLRTHALGSFADMLHAIWRDPAMLQYLDGSKNQLRKPNENFARELLELFTLGEGHYSEADIVNAARAFTGWRYAVRRDEVEFKPGQYDKGDKQFLGRSGNFGAEDIINILLEHPRTAEFIAEKFWRHFINPGQPQAQVIAQWAKVFRESGYQVSALLKQVVASQPFWDQRNRGALIKSPVEFSVGLLNDLQLDDFRAYRRLGKINAQLGQRLFYPPDVKGWRGDNAWLDNTTFIVRNNFVRTLAGEHMNEMMEGRQHMPDIQQARACLLALPPVNPPQSGQDQQEQLLALLTDPVYQLR